MSKYGLTGKFTTAPENRDTLVEILSEAADLMETAEGCHTYIVHKDANDDTAIWVTEIWESKEAHDKSLSIDGVGALIGRARPLITGIEQIVLIPVRGKGL